MKKKHKIVTVSLSSNNYTDLQSKVCQCLDEGWKIERVDSPNLAYGGISEMFGYLVYILSKEE